MFKPIQIEIQIEQFQINISRTKLGNRSSLIQLHPIVLAQHTGVAWPEAALYLGQHEGTFASAASRQLIDDQAPRRYDSLRDVVQN
jgi:hypothetical protein